MFENFEVDLPKFEISELAYLVQRIMYSGIQKSKMVDNKLVEGLLVSNLADVRKLRFLLK